MSESTDYYDIEKISQIFVNHLDKLGIYFNITDPTDDIDLLLIGFTEAINMSNTKQEFLCNIFSCIEKELIGHTKKKQWI